VIQNGQASYKASLRRAWKRHRLITSAAIVALIAPSLIVVHDAWSRNRVVYGLSVPNNNQAIVSSLVRKTGYRPQLINVFVKLDSTKFRPATLTQMKNMKATPVVTLEPWSWRSRWGAVDQPQYSLAALANGRWDSHIRKIARIIRGHRALVYLRFAHEMNGWWYPWAESVNGNLSGDYVRAWRHVHSLFRSVGCTNIRWVWSPNALTHSSRGTTDLASLYPGDRYTDIVGMTAYGHGSSAAQTFDATLRSLKAITDKPILLSETGADGPAKTQWISSFGRYLRNNPDIMGFIWFNTSPSTTGASGDYRFDDASQNVKAFRDALRTANVTSRTSATAVLG
jgi:hypothetical protein